MGAATKTTGTYSRSAADSFVGWNPGRGIDTGAEGFVGWNPGRGIDTGAEGFVGWNPGR